MKGLIYLNRYYASHTRHAEDLKRIFSEKGVDVSIMRSVPDFVYLERNGTKIVDDYDFCLFYDKDIYIASMMEKAGLRVFNKSNALAICDDKMLTGIELSSNGIIVPKTCSIPLTYRTNEQASCDYEKICTLFGSPFILKDNKGSLGTGVRLINNFSDFEKGLSYGNNRLLAQEFIKESFGKDLRVIVIGKKAVAWMARINNTGDFRSGIETGGKGYNITPPDGFIETAEKCARILDLDYCGVDLLFGKDGPLVSEVNANALTKTIGEVTGVPIASLYVEYVLSTVSDSKRVR